MNYLKTHLLLVLATCVTVILNKTTGASASCTRSNRTCGSQLLPYPFGFTAGCPIHLNCSPSGAVSLNEFPLQNITGDVITISVGANCSRPVRALRDLFSKNYAPTDKNAILLNNCSEAVSTCSIPNVNVSTNFGPMSCSSNEKISCFSELTQDSFVDSNNMFKRTSQCQYLLSSIFVEYSSNRSGVALVVQVMELRWWLPGRDCRCSKHATCENVRTPAGMGPGHRCQCRRGLLGDGSLDGDGCWKAPSRCRPAKYFSGQCGGPLRYAVIVGGVVAGAVLMIVVGLLGCLIRRRSNSKAESFRKRRLAEATGMSIPIYPYREIEKATNGFSDKQRLGTGAYGTVYAGKLHNDLWVAIKRIKNNDSIEQVMNEIKLISSVNHPNLVRLLGCSTEKGEQILVYEFMPNGTLCQHLQGERGDGLAWPIRLAIATETARAIAHLHSAIDPPIYHRDIKSSNILLDYNFMSKVADFGLSRLGMAEISHISTAPQGTPGYLDPQYHQNFHLSDKSDVYSFGVVLVEIITAMKVVDFARPQNEVNLASFAADRIGKGRIDEIIDPLIDLHSDAWTLSSVHKVAELAFRCLAFHRDTRPSMMEVAAELELIRLSKCTPSEDINCTATSSKGSSCSTSDGSEKPLNLSSSCKKVELDGKGLLVLKTQNSRVGSIERANVSSPVSVQDPWLSEQSSPSTSGLLNTAQR